MQAPFRGACLLALWALLPLTGCQFIKGITSRDEPAPQHLVVYNQKIKANTERLAALDAQEPRVVHFAPEFCRDVLDAARKFDAVIREYAEVLDTLEAQWQSTSPEQMRTALTRCDALRSALEDHAVKLSLLNDSLQTQYESLKLEVEAGRALELESTGEYLSVCGNVTLLTTSFDEYFTNIHLQGMQKSSSSEHPVTGVFHFLRLHDLGAPNLAAHAWYYDAAWKKWLDIELGQSRLDVAMEVFALVSAATNEFRPKSLQTLFEVTNAALEMRPSLEVVDRMEGFFNQVEKSFGVVGQQREDYRLALDRARANLLLCRANATNDPEEGVRLASRAVKLNSYLSDSVNRYLIKAAHEIGNRLVNAGEYAEANVAFRRVVALSSAPQQERLAESFHARTLDSVLARVKREIGTRDFSAARKTLTRATQITTDYDDKLRIREGFSWYYHAYADHLFNRDIQKAIVVCREALEFFPNDKVCKDKIDRGLFLTLRRDLGDVETAYSRFGAERVLDMLKQTVNEMYGEKWAGACQRLLADIQVAWERQRDIAKTPRQAFEIGLEIAGLDRKGGLEARMEAAVGLWNRLDASARRHDWRDVEECFETYFSLCADVPRPESFKTIFVSFLEELDRSRSLTKLGKHLAFFTRAYPSDSSRVRDIIVGNATHDTPAGRGFYELLRAIDPEAPELQEYAQTTSDEEGPPSDDGFETFLDEETLAEADTWWREPEVEDEAGVTAVEYGSPSVPARPASYRFGALSFAGGVFGGIGCLAFLVALPLLSLKRGLLPFRWYAIGAVWLGLTIGFVLGARDAVEDNSLGLQHTATRDTEAPAAITAALEPESRTRG